MFLPLDAAPGSVHRGTFKQMSGQSMVICYKPLDLHKYFTTIVFALGVGLIVLWRLELCADRELVIFICVLKLPTLYVAECC